MKLNAGMVEWWNWKIELTRKRRACEYLDAFIALWVTASRHENRAKLHHTFTPQHIKLNENDQASTHNHSRNVNIIITSFILMMLYAWPNIEPTCCTTLSTEAYAL
jgi:uncharacterized FlgJ-related protein